MEKSDRWVVRSLEDHKSGSVGDFLRYGVVFSPFITDAASFSSAVLAKECSPRGYKIEIVPLSALIDRSSSMVPDIVHRFYELSWITRLRITTSLELCNKEDIAENIREAELGRRIFARAREKGKLEELDKAITHASNK